MRFDVVFLATAVLFASYSGANGSEALLRGAANGTVMTGAVYPDSSRTSVDWNGRYVGRLPCADCEAIETELTLSPDETFVLKTRYLGRSEDWQRETGRFVWDESGQIVRLNQRAPDAKAFFVGENRLWQLDQSGQRIQGDLAELYQLHKVQEGQVGMDSFALSASLFDQPWRLKVLNGQPVIGLERPIYIEFVESEHRIQGFNGCNRFFGDVRLDDPEADESGSIAVAFSQIGMTRMACRGETHETPFMQALQETRSMRLTGTELRLLDASGQALALFEADESLKPSMRRVLSSPFESLVRFSTVEQIRTLQSFPHCMSAQIGRSAA
ncbi:copper resistance protein NlpE N-terminal domain-containing protein, partial [Thiorhodovibrio winogradskyi]